MEDELDPTRKTLQDTLDRWFLSLVDKLKTQVDTRVEKSFERVTKQFEPTEYQVGEEHPWISDP